MKRLTSKAGFSIAELMVVCFIIGMASVAMAPQFAKMWKRSDLERESGRLESSVQICRQKSVLNRKPYRLILDPGNGTFYAERRDSVGVWNADPPETVSVKHGIEFDVTAGTTAYNYDLLFEPRGTVSRTDSPARIDFWNARGETISIHVVRTGRVRRTRGG